MAQFQTGLKDVGHKARSSIREGLARPVILHENVLQRKLVAVFAVASLVAVTASYRVADPIGHWNPFVIVCSHWQAPMKIDVPSFKNIVGGRRWVRWCMSATDSPCRSELTFLTGEDRTHHVCF